MPYSTLHLFILDKVLHPPSETTVRKYRLHEDDATKDIYEALYRYGSIAREDAHLHLLVADNDHSLRLLLRILENFEKMDKKINHGYKSPTSDVVRDQYSRFNNFKSSPQYEELQSCYGAV